MSATILPASFLANLGPGELLGLVLDSTFFGKFILRKPRARPAASFSGTGTGCRFMVSGGGG